MGHWSITVSGSGTHHNKRNNKDANRMAAAFVKQLGEAGHTVDSASFTLDGGATDDVSKDTYLSDRDKVEV